MTAAAEAVLEQAKALSEEDRLYVAHTLLDLAFLGERDADWEEAWTAELDRRMADAGDPAKWATGEEVFAAAVAKYGKK
ncbi:MAG: hypothetical protein FJ100_16700 [Deltaproteobacteria bacterium]|nr:hypothetical protein [Deltaproteobacteria bacterium]